MRSNRELALAVTCSGNRHDSVVRRRSRGGVRAAGGHRATNHHADQCPQDRHFENRHRKSGRKGRRCEGVPPTCAGDDGARAHQQRAGRPGAARDRRRHRHHDFAAGCGDRRAHHHHEGGRPQEPRLHHRGTGDRPDHRERSPPFNIAQSTSQFTGGGSYVNLRDLRAARTLVLIDGQRLAPNAYTGEGVDISGIPFSAIQNVQVLRDGASALMARMRSPAWSTSSPTRITREGRFRPISTVRRTPAAAPVRRISSSGMATW